MRLASLMAVLALACNPDGGGSSTGATTTSTTTSTPTSISTAGSTGASATATSAATTDPTTGASATATSAATTDPTGATTSAPSSSSATTGTTAVTATTGAQTSGDTGGPATCGVANADYGDCDLALGVAFDGTECASRSGCDCAPDCDKFFPDMASCALACADAGHCNQPRIKAAGIAKDPIGPGDLCDEIDVCPTSADLELVFKQIFGMLSCEPGMCQGGGQTCHGLWQNMLGPDEWKKTCAASLVQGSGDILCVVFGP